MTACAYTPTLLEQNAASGTPTLATQVLIVVDDKVFTAPYYGPSGHAYLRGLETGLQNALSGVATSVVEVDPMMLTNPLPHALVSARPSHIIQLSTLSDKQLNGSPVSAVWQMNVLTVAITAHPAVQGKQTRTNFRMTPVYKSRTEGDTCLLSDSGAERCGATMGQFLGKTLLASHSVRTSADN